VYELIADLGCVYLLSLDQPFTLSSDDEETTIMDTIEDDKFVDPSVEVEFKEQRDILRKAIDALGEREQVLVKMHYFESVPFESIAEKMGVSKQRISQMHTRAIRKLRESLSSTHISEEALHNFSIEG
jgi:RNA polymerase sigma factor for flagellar operon FliA